MDDTSKLKLVDSDIHDEMKDTRDDMKDDEV